MTDSETPRLSPSIAAKLLDEGPLSAWANHRLLGNLRKPATDSQIAGKIAHAAILDDTSEVAPLDYPDFRTKEAREARDRLLAGGLIPIVQAKWDDALDMGRIVRERVEAETGIDLLDGAREMRMAWEGGEGVLCSGVIDYLAADASRVIDLKTMPGFPSAGTCQRMLSSGHTLLQDAAYREAVADAIELDFLFVQTEPPYSVYWTTMAGDLRQVSEIRWMRAQREWARLLETDGWHEPLGRQVTHAPGWLLNHEMLEEAMGDD